MTARQRQQRQHRRRARRREELPEPVELTPPQRPAPDPAAAERLAELLRRIERLVDEHRA